MLSSRKSSKRVKKSHRRSGSTKRRHCASRVPSTKDDDLLLEDRRTLLVRLEEEVVMYTDTLKTLEKRKSEVLGQLEEAKKKKQRFEEERTALKKQKEQLEESRKLQLKLLDEAKASVGRAKERLEALNSSRLIALSLEEMKMLQQGALQVEKFVTPDEVGSSTHFLPEQRTTINFRDLHQEGSNMVDFWSARSDQALMTFLPCINSEHLIREVLDVMVRETLALDKREPKGLHRRQSLLYTSLDLLQMSTKGNMRPVEFGNEGLDPDVALCPYDLAGVCADHFCPYQHLKFGRGSTLPRDRLPLPPLLLPRRPEEIESTQSQLDQSILESSGEESDSSEDDDNDDLSVAVPEKAKSSLLQEKSDDATLLQRKKGHTIEEDIERGDIQTRGILQDSPRNRDSDNDPGYLGQVIAADGDAVLEDLDDDLGLEDPDDLTSMDEFARNAEYVPLPKKIPKSKPQHFERESSKNGLVEDFFDATVMNRCSRPWWMSADSSQNDELSAPVSVTDWLYLFGKIRVTKATVSDKEGRCSGDGGNVWSLEYRREYPTNILQLIKFVARVVNCTQVVIHAGRFDISQALHKLAVHVVGEFRRVRLPVADAIFSSDQKSIELLTEALSYVEQANEVSLKFNSKGKNAFRVAFEVQMLLSTLSTFVFLFHKEYLERPSQVDEEYARWRLSLQELRSLFLSNSDSDKSCAKAGSTADLIGTIRMTLHHALCSLDEDLMNGQGSDMSCEVSSEFPKVRILVNNIVSSHSLLIDVSSAAEMASLVERILRPTWSVIGRVLRDSVNDSTRAWFCLRACVVLGHIVLGALEGTANVALSDQRSSNKVATLSEIDRNLHQMLNSVRHVVSDVPFMDILLTPLFAASVSLAAHLGFYAKAQGRLENLLGAEDTETRGQNSMALTVYSELLWSQIVQLRGSLPFHHNDMKESEKWEIPAQIFDGHRLLSSRISEYGVYLHHVVLDGDWNFVRGLSVKDSKKPRRSSSESLVKSCHTIIEHLFSSKKVSGGASVSVKGLDLIFRSRNGIPSLRSPVPRSLFLLGPSLERLQLRSCHLETLPLSFGFHCSGLLELDLSANKLRSLPESFSLLTKLRCLSINKNKLSEVPLGKVLHLLLFRASNNRLGSLPLGLKYASYLEALDISGNRIHVTESELILKFPRMRSLRLFPQLTGQNDGRGFSGRGVTSSQARSLDRAYARLFGRAAAVEDDTESESSGSFGALRSRSTRSGEEDTTSKSSSSFGPPGLRIRKRAYTGGQDSSSDISQLSQEMRRSDSYSNESNSMGAGSTVGRF